MAKRHSDEQSLSEVINKLLETYHLKDGVNIIRIREAWESLMGNMIGQRTSSISLHKHTLVINVKSAALRQELEYKKEEIKKALNEELKDDVIRDVLIR